MQAWNRKQSIHQRRRGISLLEVLVVVAIVGILGFVASGQFGKVVDKSRETVARNHLEMLNQGVSRYLQIEGDALREVAADDAGAEEEVAILRALQWVDPALPEEGGPYVRGDYDPDPSDSTEDYRAVWNGAFFELRLPGTAGAGLKIEFDGSDVGHAVVFPDNYTPLAMTEETQDETGD